MDYNYVIHSADGRVIEKSNFTNQSKSSAIQNARALLARGVGSYATITRFDWSSGERTIGRIDSNNG